MDFNLFINQILLQLLLGTVSIVFAEVIRDFYHLAGHYWQPLQRFHNLHHKAYRRDLSMTSLDAYKQAQLYNDVPESALMLLGTLLLAALNPFSVLWLGCFYALFFLIPAIARSQGRLLQTDLTHKPGDLVEIPTQWTVNRTYHWRHHFDQGNAYFCGHFTLVDKVLGTALSLKDKVVAVTGASGTMGQALIEALSQRGAKVIALTTHPNSDFPASVKIVPWQSCTEAELMAQLQKIDILIINHGLNVYGDRSALAIQDSFEVNTFSTLRLAELFLSTVTTSSHRAIKELWVNTSEAEVNPAFSPLYELSKRMLGDLLTLRRLDSPCIIRKLVLGPFKSQLNPYGVMSARWVAQVVVALAQRDFRNIIVTINPITYLTFPFKEFCQSTYFRWFTKPAQPRKNSSILSKPLVHS